MEGLHSIQLVTKDIVNLKTQYDTKELMREILVVNNNMVKMLDVFAQIFLKLESSKVEDELLALKNHVDVSVSALSEEVSSLKGQVKVLREAEASNSDKVLELECRSRRLNLIFSDIPESGRDESYSEGYSKLMNILKTKYNMDNTVDKFIFRDIHRLGKKNLVSRKPRPLIAAFVCQEDVRLVLDAAKVATDKTVRVKSDLPKVYNDLRNDLLKIRMDYRDHHNVKCNLAFQRFKPVLFKVVPGGTSVKIDVEMSAEGRYTEV